MSSILEVKGVTKMFRGLRALDDVSFSVEPGEVLGIIGPNGAGKTTLFNVISGGLRPDTGTVTFEGRDVTGWPDHQVARAGMVRTFQLMRPFAELSVLDNVQIAASVRHPQRESRAIAVEILERLGLDKYTTRQSGDLPTAALKRLELARALALRPKLLMLDEVLAGLVPSERAPLLDLLRGIRNQGVTMLFVEHVMPAVMSLSDRVLVLHQGAVISIGTPDSVISDSTVIEAYLGDEA